MDSTERLEMTLEETIEYARFLASRTDVGYNRRNTKPYRKEYLVTR